MTPLLSAAAVGSAAALALTSSVVALAARRSVKQPADCVPDVEEAVIDAVARHPQWYPMVAALTPGDFTDPDCAAAWARIEEHAGHARPDESTPRRDLDAHLAEKGRLVPADLDDLIDPYPIVCADDQVDSVKALVKAGSRILDAAAARDGLQGATPLAAGDPAAGEPAFVRREPVITLVRRVVTALLLAAGFTAALGLPVVTAQAAAPSGSSLVAIALGVLALGLLTVGGAVWALVDHDTLYVDTVTFWPVTGAAYAAGIAAAYAADDLFRVTLAVIVVAVTAGLLEGANAVYRLVRGRWGLGGGDTILMIATVGLPVLVTGQWQLGYASLMAGLLAACAGYVVGAVRGRSGRTMPFAFGPYLVAGWLIAGLGACLTGTW